VGRKKKNDKWQHKLLIKIDSFIIRNNNWVNTTKNR